MLHSATHETRGFQSLLSHCNFWAKIRFFPTILAISDCSNVVQEKVFKIHSIQFVGMFLHHSTKLMTNNEQLASCHPYDPNMVKQTHGVCRASMGDPNISIARQQSIIQQLTNCPSNLDVALKDLEGCSNGERGWGG